MFSGLSPGTMQDTRATTPPPDRTTIPFMASFYCPTDFFTENVSPFCYRIYWRQLHLLRYRTGCKARQSLLLHVRIFSAFHRSQPATSKWLSDAHLSTNKTAINSWTTTNQFRSSIHGFSSPSSLTATGSFMVFMNLEQQPLDRWFWVGSWCSLESINRRGIGLLIINYTGK